MDEKHCEIKAFIAELLEFYYHRSRLYGDTVPLLPYNTRESVFCKWQWPRLYSRKDHTKQKQENEDGILHFHIPIVDIDKNRKNIDEFIDDLLNLKDVEFIRKYIDNPPFWYLIECEVLNLSTLQMISLR